MESFCLTFHGVLCHRGLKNEKSDKIPTENTQEVSKPLEELFAGENIEKLIRTAVKNVFELRGREKGEILVFLVLEAIHRVNLLVQKLTRFWGIRNIIVEW